MTIPNLLSFPRVTALGVIFLLGAVAQPQVCSNKQTKQEVDARIDRLIATMTLKERVAQLQDRAPAIERLGVPAYNWWNEGLHGVARNGYATVFPQAIGMAATWDADLLHAIGDVVSTEARAKFAAHAQTDSPRYGGLTIWSPNINIFRDPRWGRGQETYGEDPFLTATLGTQFVKGIQGDDAFYRKADATAKHFAVHSGPEEGRNGFNVNPSPHDLADTYLPAFYALTTSAKATAVMCSYNAIDGTPACANANLLAKTLRTQWDFHGYVVSDCDAVGNIAAFHHFATDAAHGAAAALNAGDDLNCGDTYLALDQSVAQHLTTEAAVDQALHRLLFAKTQLGLLDPAECTPYNGIGMEANDTAEHRALALRAATESIVLLKNDGVLPLAASQRLAVIGVDADSVKVLEGNYHGTASAPSTPLEALIHIFREVHAAQGSLLVDQAPAIVPRSALRVSASRTAAAGLHAEYFNNADFGGAPAVSKTVPTIDFDLDRAGPDIHIDAMRNSARWTGTFVPPAPGDYVLRVHIDRCYDCKTHDHARLFLNDTLALDLDGTQGAKDSVTVHAGDTEPHTLRLELVHNSEDEGIALEWFPPSGALLEEAMRVARAADTIVAFVGLSPDLEGEEMPVHLEGFTGGDRTTLDLPASQKRLLHALASLHKPLVLVLNAGSAVALDPADYGAGAMLAAWYPGEEGGHALAQILTGAANPSGRLPITVYRSIADLPAFSDYSMAHRTYRYFDGPVLFPFGFGLSYTRFTYGTPVLSKADIHAGDRIVVSATVRNTGQRSGTEVSELYLKTGRSGAPRLSLAGTQRTMLKPGETKTLSFTLTPAQLSSVDTAGARSVAAGDIQIFVGGSQPDISGKAQSVPLHISGTLVLDSPPQL